MLPPLPETEKVAETPKRQSNWLVYFMLMVVIIGAIIVGVMFFQLQQNRSRNNQPTVTPTTTINPSVTPSVTDVPTVTALPNSVDQNNLTSKIEIGENSDYSLYVVDYSTVDSDNYSGKLGVELIGLPGKIQVIDKVVTIRKSAALVSSPVSGVLIVATGATNQKNIKMIDLTKADFIGNDFCSTGAFNFWKDYVIYLNCDTSEGIKSIVPDGSTPSIVARSLKTDKESLLVKSTEKSISTITSITADTLNYQQATVSNVNDWNDQTKITTLTKTGDLNQLD